MEQKYHILVVDDDATLTTSIEYALKKQNFYVTISNSGKEALMLLKGGLDPDPANWTDEDIDAVAQRARRGERITL